MVERREGHRWLEWMLQRSALFVAVAALAGVVGGIAAWAAGARFVADAFWAATTALLLVESHRARIMQKLRLSSRAELVRYALASGALELERAQSA